MKQLIFSAFICGAAVWTPVCAATLNGDTIDVSYTRNGLSQFYTTFTVPSTDINLFIDPGDVGNVVPTGVTYTFGGNVDFDKLGLLSITFTDRNVAKTIAGVSFDAGTDVKGLTDSNLSFGTHFFTISLAGLNAASKDFIGIDVAVLGAPMPVPIPSSGSLIGFALVALGAAGYTAKRRNASVS